MPIELSEEATRRIHQAVHDYVLEEFGEDLGVLRTGKLLDFVMGLIGASVYNQAIADAQAWLQGKMMDLPGDLHQEISDFRFQISDPNSDSANLKSEI